MIVGGEIMAEDISAIIDLIKNGQKEEFTKLLDIFQQKIFRYCYYMLGQQEEAEDAVQEVFLKAYNNINRYQTSSNFSAWLYKIAHNHCVNKLRHRKIIKFLPINLENFVLKTHISSSIENKELNERLEEALNHLSAVERSIILMRIIEEKRYKEIAELLNYKPATLRKKYQRACKKLQNILLETKGVSENGYDLGSIT